VASLVPTHHPELLQIPLDQYQVLSSKPLGELPVLRLQREIWVNSERCVVHQRATFARTDPRPDATCEESGPGRSSGGNATAKPRSGPRTPKAAKPADPNDALAQHLNKVLKPTTIPRERVPIDCITSSTRQPRAVGNELYGKRFLITDRNEWSDEQILLAIGVRVKSRRRSAKLKATSTLAVRPQYHWTDQKICVHTFCCLLALLLGRVIEFRRANCHYTQTLRATRCARYRAPSHGVQTGRQQGWATPMRWH